MLFTPAEISAALARHAEVVCRRYLSNGHRQGRYWIVGDVRNTPGRSTFVRLLGPARGQGAAGRWTDAATGEHGDLLDVIRSSLGLVEFREVMDEAGRFLMMAPTDPISPRKQEPTSSPVGTAAAARRLLAISRPITNTLVQTYLRGRGIVDLRGTGALRFHPRCYYVLQHGPTETWPAMIATVTDLAGAITGAHRTWLAPDGAGKAPIATPRRAMGELLGHAVRFGTPDDVMVAGEGIETILALRQVMPGLPMAATLSSAHLAAMRLPKKLRRLYVARDDDAAGDAACERLVELGRTSGVDIIVLSPILDDFNDDLTLLGRHALKASLRTQLSPEDVVRFLT